MKLEISASRLLELWNCPKQFWDTIRGNRKEVTEFEVIGDATHMLAAGDTPAEARRFVERKLTNRPASVREDAYDKAVTMSKTAERKKEPEVTPDAIERQLVWSFRLPERDGKPSRVWKIFGKPDRIFFFDEDQDDGSTLEVLEIDELKTSERAKRWHWDQLFLFGTIASEVLDYRGPIKLVVIPLQYVARVMREKREQLELSVEQLSARSGVDARTIERIEASKDSVSDEDALKLAKAFDMTPEAFDEMINGGNEVMWYSQSHTWRTKQRIAETLEELERRWEARDFKETPGGHCFGCKSRPSCALGQEFVARRLAEQAERRLAADAAEDDGEIPDATTDGELPVVA